MALGLFLDQDMNTSTSSTNTAAVMTEDDHTRTLALYSYHNAPKLCHAAHGCTDYHRSWSLVRWLDLGGKPPAGSAFFKEWITRLADQGRRRVLISGGADTGLTALALDIYKELSALPDITFVDQCQTPVEQNKILATQRGITLKAEANNILGFNDKPFDIILAHSFLYFFPPETRVKLIKHWYELLAPGGVLLLSQVVHEDEYAEQPMRESEAIRQRANQLGQRLSEQGLSDQDCQEATEVLTRFWMTPVSRPPYPTLRTIEQQATQAGFEIAQIIMHEAKPENSGPISIRKHTDLKGRFRLELAARKPS
jgi:SAM-dependent methyltransferase